MIKDKVDTNNQEIFRYSITTSDVLIARTSETIKEIAYSSCLLENIANCTYSGFLLKASPKIKNIIFPPYIVLLLRSQIYRKRLMKLSTETSRALINSDNLAKLIIIIPKFEEQKKIWLFFNLLLKKITITEQKIETLKKYKEGLVNQVILPLFKNETLSLNDACKITTGKLDANAMAKDGKYKFFTCSRGDFFINKYAFDCEALLISGNGEVGLSKYYKGKFNAYQRTYVLYDFKIDATFIKLCFDAQINSVIKEETNKGAMPYIRLSSFSKIKIPQISNSKVNMISCVFKTIDLKIKDEENALCNIKKIKQYFLENMFI